MEEAADFKDVSDADLEEMGKPPANATRTHCLHARTGRREFPLQLACDRETAGGGGTAGMKKIERNRFRKALVYV